MLTPITLICACQTTPLSRAKSRRIVTNRTDAGAEAHAILASVLRTCQKQGFDPVAVLKHLLHSAETLIFDLVAKPKRGATLPPAMAPP